MPTMPIVVATMTVVKISLLSLSTIDSSGDKMYVSYLDKDGIWDDTS